MSTRFSHRVVEQDLPLAVERQQAVLLNALRAARGGPVSFEALREAGVEFPASVVSELELAGVQIERCREYVQGARRVVGVRLAPAYAEGGKALDAGGPLLAVRDMSIRRRLAPLAFAAGPALVVALVIAGLLTEGGGGAGHRGGARVAGSATRSPTAHLSTYSHSPAARAAAPASTRPPGPAHPPVASGERSVSPTPVSALLADRLEARGHELLQAGRFGEAVPILRRALAATGERLGGCLQPQSESCLTYAYALYDLGRALRLNGHPVAAVGVLEDRLQIENQRPVVAAELASARQQLG